MTCPKCGKFYRNGIAACPFCGYSARRRAVGTTAKRPAENMPRTSRPQSKEQRENSINRTIRHKKKEGALNRRSKFLKIVLVWVLAILAIAGLFLFIAYKRDQVSKDPAKEGIGEKFIRRVVKGEADEALDMLPYRAEELYGSVWREEYRTKYGSDFSRFSKDHAALGIEADDIDSFIKAVYQRQVSEYSLFTYDLGGCDVDIKTVSSGRYDANQMRAYFKQLKSEYKKIGVDIGEYIDFDKVTAVDENKYELVLSTEESSQKTEVSLYLLEIGGEWYVMPTTGSLLSASYSAPSIIGSWYFYEEPDGTGEKVTVTFKSNGTGSVSNRGKSSPLTYTVSATNALVIDCDALDAFVSEGRITCSFKLEGDTMTLIFPDGTIDLTRVVAS